MYCALDRLDLGLRFPAGPEASTALFVQTDHRTAREIVDDGPLSVVFAITRCLLAWHAAEESEHRPYRVVYQLHDDPPPVLDYVVQAAGATIVREISPAAASVPVREPRFRELEALIADACARLAAEIWKREDIPPTLEALAAYERRVFTPCDREDCVTFFTELVTLGALAASLLLPPSRTWRVGSSIVPFVLANGETELDVFGRAERYLDGDRQAAPSRLVAEALGISMTRRGLLSAYEELTGERVGPAGLTARALAGAPDDARARGHAETLARAAAGALRAWGLDIGAEVRWRTRPPEDTVLHPIGAPVHEIVERAHRGYDGVSEIVDEVTPLADVLERKVDERELLDPRRKDWDMASHLASAVALGLRVPDDAPRFAGARFGDVPDPFTPLLGVWATGYLVESMDATGTTLIVLAPRS